MFSISKSSVTPYNYFRNNQRRIKLIGGLAVFLLSVSYNALAESVETPDAVKFDNFPKTEFGSGDVTKRFVWVEYDSGVRILMDANQAEREGLSIEGKTVIKVNHSSDTSDRLTASDQVNIDGTFVNNQITDPNDEHPWGAGVWVPRPGPLEDNELPSGETVPGTSVDTIKGTFIGNRIDNPNAAYGAGVANSLMDNIDEINGTFVGNITASDNATGNSGGAAISNDYMVGKISGDFIGNTAIGYNTSVGGAIIDNGENTLYSGNFIGNSTITTNQGSNGAFWGAYPGSVGGAIILALNGDGADFNNINFYNNQAVALAEYMPAYGGSIFAYANELNFNYATFDGNQAIANSGQALGGAMMLSTNNTRLNNVVFRNNMVIDNGVSGYASGGAIKGAYGYLGVTNSSFYDNTSIARGEYGWADGGAITLDTGLLEIVADGGRSEFSGNKVIGIDENGNEVERNEAIYLGTGAILNLTAINDGVIKIDDVINRYGNTTSNPTVQIFTQDQFDDMIAAMPDGGTVTQDGNRYTLSIVDPIIDGQQLKGYENHEIIKIDDVYYLTKSDLSISGNKEEFRGTEAEMIAEMFTIANDMSGGSLTDEYSNIGNGFRPNCNDDRSYCKVQMCMGGEGAEGSGECIAFTATRVEEDVYIFEQKTSLTQVAGIPDMLLVNGDDSGRIELNERITGFPAMLVNGGNVFFGEKSEVDYTINALGGSVNKAQIEDGGVLDIAKGATANDTKVNSGGKLLAAAEAKVNGLLANGGAIIDLEAGTVLTGDVHFDVSAVLQGDFDYSKIFEEIASETGSLTLEGGINTALSADALVNNSNDKTLVLSGSNSTFELGNRDQKVSGWKELNVVNNATIKLVADADTTSHINSGTLNLLKDTTLNLSGNSPLIATIDGSVNNDGHLEFKHKDDNTDDADDITTIKGNYKAYKNAMMTIDVDPTSAVSDKLVIEGDVEGRTKVVINPLNNALSTGKALFVEAMNDDLSTGAYFDIFRVDGSAYTWNSLYEDNKWYVATDDIIASSSSGYGTVNDNEELVLGGNNTNDTNITQPKPQVVAEALAYMSLPRIGLEQTKDLVRIVSNKVASTKAKCGNCGVSEYAYDGKALNGVWIDLGNKKSNIDAPVEVEAKVKAVDLGFDVQSDLHHRLGIFASYRQGEYELSGMGKDYYSKVGSDIDVDSWMMGLYHRYDKGRIWTMSTLYAGLQKIDLTTDDGVSADTEGKQLGGSIEVGMVFEPQKRLTIEPSIRLGYNFIKYDDISDRYGKTAQYDNIHNIEAEAGVKVEKTWYTHNNGMTKLYFKPSLIQNLGKGDINITSLDTVEGLENDTLLRGEIGGSINLGNGWSGYGAVGHTFGDDYNATDYNLGIGYSW